MFGTDGTSHFKVSLPCKLINLLLFLIALRNSGLEVPSKIDIFSRTSNRSFYEMFGTDGTSHFKVSLPCKLINLLLFLIALRNSDLEVPSKIDIFSRTSNRSFYEMFGTDGTSHFKVSLPCKLINLLLFLIALRNSSLEVPSKIDIFSRTSNRRFYDYCK